MFAYCNNNPVMFVDPNGDSWVLFGIIVALVSAVHVIARVNHTINMYNEYQIDQEIEDSYTEETAQEAINQIADNYGEDIRVVFRENDVMINNSYKIDSRYDRQKISMIISRTGVTNREYDNLSAEWYGHNVIEIFKPSESTKHVNLDYTEDERPLIRFGTNLLEFLGMD